MVEPRVLATVNQTVHSRNLIKMSTVDEEILRNIKKCVAFFCFVCMLKAYPMDTPAVEILHVNNVSVLIAQRLTGP